MNIATTKEQSSRLLQCGVSADTADMVWTRFESDGEKYEQLSVMDESAYEVASLNHIPAWSLSALLGLLPKSISYFWMTKWFVPITDGFEIDDMENPYQLSGDFQLLHLGGGNYQVEYDWNGFCGKLPQSENPIEACVLAIELLVANGYKLNEQ